MRRILARLFLIKAGKERPKGVYFLHETFGATQQDRPKDKQDCWSIAEVLKDSVYPAYRQVRMNRVAAVGGDNNRNGTVGLTTAIGFRINNLDCDESVDSKVGAWRRRQFNDAVHSKV